MSLLLAVGSASGPTYTLTAEAGAYTLSGQDAGLAVNRALTADPGTYNLSGGAATILRSRVLIAGAGAYSLTGQSAGLTRNRVLVAQAGAYTLSGQAATITYTPSASADVKVSWLQLDTSATPVDVKVSWLQLDTAATPCDVRVSWCQFDTAAPVATVAAGGGGWLPSFRRRTRKQLHAERVRLGILPPDIVRAATKAAAVVLDGPYRADSEAVNKVFLRELGATMMLPDYRRAIQIQIELMRQEEEEILMLI